jgi:hypothetical protein
MADPRRTDPSRGFAADNSPKPGDRNFMGPVQPTALNQGPHDYVKSHTPAERRAEKDGAQTKRLQATTRGVNGIDVVKNTHQLNELEAARPGGQRQLQNIMATGNLNGVPARCFIAAYSSPNPI